MLSVRIFLSGDDFEVVLVIFCCYNYVANASEAVEKITADEKDYYKCPLQITISSITRSWLL